MLLYAMMGTIDVIQFAITPTGIGVVINEIADPIIGALLIGYFQLRGVSMITRIDRLLSLIGVAALEGITGGLAPAWIIDIWYIHRSVKKETAEMEAQQAQAEFLQSNIRQPLYKDGVRAPRMQETSQTQPINMDGVRAPRSAQPLK